MTGHCFMTMGVPPPDPGYGPFVLVTSAHSDSITDWDGSGDAIIAIHGPIDSVADAEIGSTGAEISHGCVRLHDADLSKLSMIPAGTPIDIVAGGEAPQATRNLRAGTPDLPMLRCRKTAGRRQEVGQWPPQPFPAGQRRHRRGGPSLRTSFHPPGERPQGAGVIRRIHSASNGSVIR